MGLAKKVVSVALELHSRSRNLFAHPNPILQFKRFCSPICKFCEVGLVRSVGIGYSTEFGWLVTQQSEYGVARLGLRAGGVIGNAAAGCHLGSRVHRRGLHDGRRQRANCDFQFSQQLNNYSTELSTE
ncbi:hypothetical protein ACJJTC_004377 [Scirpophaga incertulas]